MGSAYLEERAKLSREAFEVLGRWNPSPFGGLGAETVKAAILTGTGDLVLKSMIAENAVPPAEREQLLRVLAHSRGVFDNTQLVDAGHGVRERVFANVYDMLLGAQRIGADHGHSSTVFRGQSDSGWKLIPSYYRANPRRAEHLKRTVLAGQVAHLQAKYPHVSFSELTPFQQEAAVQHYFSGTELLDFTDSIYVAAFFATYRDPPLTNNAKMGAVYRISRKDIENLMLAKVEAPEMPSAFLRIHRQRGVFLRIEYREAINEPGMFDRWAFYHTIEGSAFESAELGVTAQFLLAEQIE